MSHNATTCLGKDCPALLSFEAQKEFTTKGIQIVRVCSPVSMYVNPMIGQGAAPRRTQSKPATFQHQINQKIHDEMKALG